LRYVKRFLNSAGLICSSLSFNAEMEFANLIRWPKANKGS